MRTFEPTQEHWNRYCSQAIETVVRKYPCLNTPDGLLDVADELIADEVYELSRPRGKLFVVRND